MTDEKPCRSGSVDHPGGACTVRRTVVRTHAPTRRRARPSRSTGDEPGDPRARRPSDDLLITAGVRFAVINRASGGQHAGAPAVRSPG